MCICSPLYHNSSDHILYLNSFPTRRSSDLLSKLNWASICDYHSLSDPNLIYNQFLAAYIRGLDKFFPQKRENFFKINRRSEEHTSELQSRRDLVCRLLLEKKKTYTIYLNIQ